MAISQSQRLRRAAQKASRRKAVVAEKRKAELSWAAGEEARQIVAAAQAPIHSCTMMAEMFDAGIGWVVLARSLPSGSLATGFFLVDVWCMGIKDAFFRTMSRQEFEEQQDAREFAQVAIEPSRARKLLLGAAAYAAGLGIKPAKEFAAVEMLFGDVPLGTDDFEFGNNGEPHYVPGPNDSPYLVHRINVALDRYFAAEGAGSRPAIDTEASDGEAGDSDGEAGDSDGEADDTEEPGGQDHR